MRPTRQPLARWPHAALLLGWGAAALLFGGGAGGSARPAPDGGAPDLLLTDLRAAAARSALRADGLRLTIDPAAPTAPATGGPPADVVGVAARVAGSAAGGAPEALHAAALVDLRWGELSTARLDRVIARLNVAARTSAAPGAALADLAAARLLRAEREQDGQALVAALEAAAEAVELRPGDLTAQYTLTRVLDRAGLTTEAARRARAYLARDSVSRWAVWVREAARFRPPSAPARAPAADADSAAIAAFVRRDHQTAREFGWTTVLGRWADATLAGDPAAAATALRLAHAVGRALTADGGDASLSDLATALRRGAAPRDAARALASFRTGQQAYRAGDYTGASAHLECALARRGAPDVLRAWTRALLGAAYVHRGMAARGERALWDARAAGGTRRRALAGRAAASLGTSLLRAGRDAAAARVIAWAERDLVASGEPERLGAVRFLRAEAEFGRGDEPAGYATAWRALRTLRSLPPSVWRHNTLYALAQQAALDGAPRAAALVQDEDVAAGAATGRPLDAAEALLARARLRAGGGRLDGAADDVRRARARVAEVAPGPDREWLDADVHLSESRLVVARRPAAAAALADSAARFFAARGVVFRLIPAVAARGEAHAAAGRASAALADLGESAHLLGRRAERLRSPQARALLLSESRRVLDRLVLLRLSRDGPAAALADVEAARALIAPASAPHRTAPAHLGPRTETALVLTRMADTLLAWTVTERGVHLARTTVSAGSLDRVVARARAALETRQPDASARVPLAALYEQLIRPVARDLGPEGRGVVIVTDGGLAAVPFAALYDARRGRYLVEDRPLRFAESLHDAEPRLPRPPSGAAVGGAGRVLVVGDPGFDTVRYSSLRRLPGAADEARRLAAVYPGARVLTGPAADGARVSRLLPGARVVHYAGHAVFDPVRPERSYLVLGGAGVSGRLGADAVSALALGRVRLVVLAACQSVGGRRDALAGVSGLAGAFRAAGAAGVVGATWRVDDGLTRPLMLAFHRAYAATGDGPAALRAAQLEMLHETRPALRSPAAWAAFHYVGQ